MFLGLTLIVIRSPDIAALAAFYAQFGLEFTAEQHGNGPRHFAATLGSGVLELYPGTPVSGVVGGIAVGSLAAVVDLCTRNGIDHRPTGNGVIIVDPAGNKLLLSQAP